MKLDQERLKKANSITSDLKEIFTMVDIAMSDDDEEVRDYLKTCISQRVSEIICALDTDVAINVLERFGEEGGEIARNIKIEYGY